MISEEHTWKWKLTPNEQVCEYLWVYVNTVLCDMKEKYIVGCVNKSKNKMDWIDAHNRITLSQPMWRVCSWWWVASSLLFWVSVFCINSINNINSVSQNITYCTFNSWMVVKTTFSNPLNGISLHLQSTWTQIMFSIQSTTMLWTSGQRNKITVSSRSVCGED